MALELETFKNEEGKEWIGIVVEWKVVNKNDPNRVYQTVQEYFAEENDDKNLEDHMLLEKQFLEDGRLIGKKSDMNPDGKSFTHKKWFKNEESYNAFQEARMKLPRIDKHLSNTLINSYNEVERD